MNFESRRGIDEDITKSLNDDRVRVVAICGAGGVGKTTMVQRIEERVRSYKLFDEVVTVMLKFHKEIAESLGLRLNADTLYCRAHQLRTRIMDPNRKLIILDDVWESFEIEDLRVPFANSFEGCKVILTTRSKDVCGEMEEQKIIPFEVLDKQEAWALFRQKSDYRVNDSNFAPIAKGIVEECGGLPLTLVTVAKALQEEKTESWNDALFKLKSMNFSPFHKSC